MYRACNIMYTIIIDVVGVVTMSEAIDSQWYKINEQLIFNPEMCHILIPVSRLGAVLIHPFCSPLQCIRDE